MMHMQLQHVLALLALHCNRGVAAADSSSCARFTLSKGAPGLSLRAPEIQDPSLDEDLLVEGPEDVGGVFSPSPIAKAEGTTLLKQDLEWLANAVQMGLAWLLLTVKAFYADVLAWATAFVSFRLTRSLLKVPDLQVAEKAVEASCEEEEAEEVIQEGEQVQAEDETAEEWERLVSMAQREERDAFGCSLLHLAAHRGQIKATQRLLEMGFDPNATEHSKETPLHMAARAGCVGTVKLLLSYRAQPGGRNCFGKTALAVAMHSDHELAALLREAALKPAS